MARNIPHELLTDPGPDLRARQRFVLQFKREVERLHRHALAAREQGGQVTAAATDEATQAEIGNLYADDLYRTLCALKLRGQAMMWESIDAAVLAEADRLSGLFRRYSGAATRLGSLHLDPALDVGDAWRRARVHLQPDGYQADAGPDDVRAGALYEEGGALYSRGRRVGTRESKAECAIRFIREWQPGFRPTRILDMGCSAGASTIPYALAFPDAEVYGIDLFPALLRYAHAKAESVRARVHFHQAQVEAVPFADGSFDLVVSHNAMHEMSQATCAAMFRESHRLLAPGGLCVHQDLPARTRDLTSLRRADLLFEEWFNGELFWTEFLDRDCDAYLDAAGFPPAGQGTDWRKSGLYAQLDGTMSWSFVAARKPGPA